MTETANLSLLNFDTDDLTPRELPVKFRGLSYVLREASEDAVCRYRNKIMECTVMQDGKAQRVQGMADVEPLLVSLCLFEEAPLDTMGAFHPPPHRDGRLYPPGLLPVPLEVVLSWPNRVVKKLFETAKRISDLEHEEPATEEGLRESIQQAQAKLDQHLASRNGQTGGGLKNAPAATTGSSV